MFCNLSHTLCCSLTTFSKVNIIRALIQTCALFSASGMTPLHCAAISHSASVKAFPSIGLADVGLQTVADEKLSCVKMLLEAGASLLSQVRLQLSFF